MKDIRQPRRSLFIQILNKIFYNIFEELLMKKPFILLLFGICMFLSACEQQNSNSTANSAAKKRPNTDTSKTAIESNPLKSEDTSPFWLAHKYYFGTDGYEQNYTKAFALFNKAYQEKESCANIALGNMYYKGYGIKKDIKKAFQLWDEGDDCSFRDGNNIYSFDAYNNNREYIIENKDKNRAFAIGDSCFGRYDSSNHRCGYASTIDDDDRYNNRCEQGEQWYRLAAKYGHPEAKVRLADNYLIYDSPHFNCYIDFNGEWGDTEEAYLHRQEGEKLLLSAAEQGYTAAWEELGRMHFYGYLPLDHQKAEREFFKAASKGMGYSALMLARLYSGEKDTDIPADYSKAYYWAKQAVQRGIDAGNYYLGLLYYNGQAVKKDHAKALVLFKKVTNKSGYEYLLAGFKLQQLYLDEDVTKQNLKELAQEDERCYYYYCTKGWIFGKENYAKATSQALWQAAFEKNDILAQIYLMHQYEISTNEPNKESYAILRALIALHSEPKNEHTKMEWTNVRKAIADESKKMPSLTDYKHVDREDLIHASTLKNDIEAQRALGRLYINKAKAESNDSYAQEQNLTQAFEWYTLAAMCGDSIAQIQLASMYGKWKMGLHRVAYDPNNIPEEIYWLEKAATQGNPLAEYELANKYYNGVMFTDETGAISSQRFRELYLMRNLKKAFELYKRAAEAGYVPAMEKLSYMYEHGEYIHPDYQEEKYWKKKAKKFKEKLTADDMVNFYTKDE